MKEDKPPYKFQFKDFIPGRGWLSYAVRNGKGTPYYGTAKQLVRTTALWPYHFGLMIPFSLGISVIDLVRDCLEKKSLEK